MMRLDYVFTVAAAVLVAVICSASACEAPFEAVGSGCFYIVNNELLSWAEARGFCQSLAAGADLAKVDDCNLMYQLWTLSGGGNHWIGGTDSFEEGVWEWVDGTLVSMGMPFWAPTQPSGGDENCLEMHNNLDGYFNDGPCDDAYRFICQDFS